MKYGVAIVVSKIDREGDTAGNDRGSVRSNCEHSDREPYLVRVVPDRILKRTNDIDGADKRIFSHRPRSRAARGLSSPTTSILKVFFPWIPVTIPIGMSRRSSVTPCSICASRKRATGKPSGRFTTSWSAPRTWTKASFTETPPLSRTSSTMLISRRPVKTAEPIMPGAKRDPSSFIQATTSIELRGRKPEFAMASTASRAAITP